MLHCYLPLHKCFISEGFLLEQTLNTNEHQFSYQIYSVIATIKVIVIIFLLSFSNSGSWMNVLLLENIYISYCATLRKKTKINVHYLSLIWHDSGDVLLSKLVFVNYQHGDQTLL